MSEMLKRVCEAIYWTAPRMRRPTTFDDIWGSSEDREELVKCARAAISAMREPTEAMIEAMNANHDGPFEASYVWQAAIDVALKGTP